MCADRRRVPRWAPGARDSGGPNCNATRRPRDANAGRPTGGRRPPARSRTAGPGLTDPRERTSASRACGCCRAGGRPLAVGRTVALVQRDRVSVDRQLCLPVDRCAACSADATVLTRVPRPPGGRRSCSRSAGSVRHTGLSGAVCRTDAAYAAGRVELHDQWRRGGAGVVAVGGVRRATAGNGHGRHPLRHQVVQARHHLDGGFGRHVARRRRHRRRLRHRLV